MEFNEEVRDGKEQQDGIDLVKKYEGLLEVQTRK